MKKLKDSPKVDLSDWQLDSFDKLAHSIREAVGKAASEALTLALEDEDTYLSFPIQWAPSSDGHYDKAVTDPLTLYLHLALSDSGDEPCVFKCTLRDALTRTLADTAEDGSFSYGLSRLSAALRELADEVDQVVNEAPKT
jgi:hypothetical protein